MKAMVFAAGLGTRLYPITKSKPKALVEVGGVPMLQRVIEKLIDNRVDELVVNVHHFPDMIIDFLKIHDNFGIKIHVSDERALLLDTGGAILKAREYLDGDEPFIVHNADILTDFNLREMIEAHMNSKADVSLLMSKRESSRYLLLDNDMRMKGWINAKSGETKPNGICEDGLNRLAFGGVHVVSPSIFRKLDCYNNGVGEVFSITSFYIDSCGELDIRGYVPPDDYYWFDIGRPTTLEKACRMFENKP